jgi:HD-like signal output (HDOD) protein
MQANQAQIGLHRLIDGDQLPALPQSAVRLLELSKDADNGPIEFAVPIEADPGLTGQVLRFVNSSYFGFRQEISSVKLAISLVGVRTIKNFALWSAVFSLMPNPKCGPFDLQDLWRDSLRRGILARAIARLLGLPEAEELFAAGLLQDMAIPLLASELPGTYRRLLEARREGLYRLSDLERSEFGWTHAEAGGLMARRWCLPEATAAMLDGHSSEGKPDPSDRGSHAISLIRLSAFLPSVVDSQWHEEEAFSAHYRSLVGKRAPPVEVLLGRVDEEYATVAPALRLSSPIKSLVESFLEVHAATG